MINRINQVKEGLGQIKKDIYTKVTAVVGVAAILGLALMLGMQQKASHRR